MDNKNTFLLMMTLFTFSLAHTSFISTNLPYSSGEFSLLSEKDTISFSNGIRIFSMKFRAPQNTPEGSTNFGAIAFQWSSGKAFYRYNSTLISKKLSMEPNTSLVIGAANATIAHGNIDTIWTAAKNTPLLTFPSDSIIKREADSSLNGYSCKILFEQDNSEDPFYPEIKSRPFSEYNSIVYFLPAAPENPSMKIQATSLKFDTTHHQTPSGFCDQIVVSQIKIRWAIDSLGNGVFKSATGVSSPQRIGNIPSTKSKKKACVINGTRAQDQNDKYYLNGRLLKGQNFHNGMVVKDQAIHY